MTLELNALLVEIESFIPETTDREVVLRFIASLQDTSGKHDRKLWPTLFSQPDMHQKPLQYYISPLFTVSSNKNCKINDQIMVGLPLIVDTLNDFVLHIEIQFVDWVNGKPPRHKLFFSKEVKQKDVFANPDEYEFKSRYRKTVRLSHYTQLSTPLTKYSEATKLYSPVPFSKVRLNLNVVPHSNYNLVNKTLSEIFDQAEKWRSGELFSIKSLRESVTNASNIQEIS